MAQVACSFESAHFISEHRKELEDADSGVYVYGQEKALETVNLAKMNLAVNGLRGEIKKANTYYEDSFGSFGAFDFVLANTPFNVDDVSLSSIEKDKRFNTYGIPRKKTKGKKKDAGKETVPNGNYLWINLFATSLKSKGRAALVMANSASDARRSEADIRQTLVEKNLIYAMLTLPSNMNCARWSREAAAKSAIESNERLGCWAKSFYLEYGRRRIVPGEAASVSAVSSFVPG